MQWTSRWADISLVAGVDVREVAAAVTGPSALLSAAYDQGEPSSWCRLAPAVVRVADRVAPGGAVLVVTDGVPGDAAELAHVVSLRPSVRFTLVTTGVSVHGLESDGGVPWWQEELAGLDVLAELPNVRTAAVRLRADGSFELGDSRAAELALRLAGGKRRGVPA